ncbi:MAG TPA: EthD domain-containing protein [Acidimicrobiales bacterium]|nr:EthD domain-containing protein [Acidimicrobiales bacterium]
MEKLVYLLIGPPGSVDAGVSSTLREQTIPALRSLGARSCQLNVTDPELGYPFGVEPEGTDDQILVALFVWVDAAEGLAPRLVRALPDASATGASWHGWLVCEAEPIRNTAHPPGPDGRVPGFAQIVALTRPSHLSWAEWRRAWQGDHTSVAINTQSTFRYVQNVVFRALTPGAPAYAAVVEECFPLEASTDLHVFFDAVGDDAKLSRHMAAMSESCDRFMDGASPVSWTTEWVFGS